MLSGSNCIDIVDVSIFIIPFNIFSCDFGKNCSGPSKNLDDVANAIGRIVKMAEDWALGC